MPIKHPCAGIGCGKPVKSNQKSIACDQCDKWVHLKCTDLSQGQFDFLSQNEDSTFYCLHCKPRTSYADLIFDDPDEDPQQYPNPLDSTHNISVESETSSASAH